MSNFTVPPAPPKRVVIFLGIIALLSYVFLCLPSYSPMMRGTTRLAIAPSISSMPMMGNIRINRTISTDNGDYYADKAAYGIGGGTMMGESLVARDAIGIAPSPIPPVPGSVSAPTDTVRMIRTADIELIVKDTDTTARQIDALRIAYGGYAGNSSFYEPRKGERQGVMTIWVPSEKLDAALAEIRGLGVRVGRESVSAEDVSGRHDDIAARLHTARATEAAYLEIMKRTGEVKDILEVAQRLASVRGEIESLEASLADIDKRVSYSAITITLTPEASPSAEASDWSPISVAKEALRNAIATLKAFASGLIGGMIGLIALIPILLFCGLILWILIWIGKKSFGILHSYTEKL